jgi:D-alanyl-D-alanine carboxypeptidase/D-alanyl-D-alanine-endopeptidase (penicillin-binding protein 4)
MAPRSLSTPRAVAMGVAAVLGMAAVVGAGTLGFVSPGAKAIASAVVPEPVAPANFSASRPAPSAPQDDLRFPTCSLQNLVEDSSLGEFHGVVMDPRSGVTVFDREATPGVAPASVLKIITAAAALSVLGPDVTFSTRVLSTDTPGTIALVGGGDATLSSLEAEDVSVYVGAPRFSVLAAQTIAALSVGLAEGEKVEVSELVVDASLWDPEDSWDSSWATSARSRGFMSRISALQVDGDRQDPRIAMSPRSNNPTKNAAESFVQALTAAGNTSRFVALTYGASDPGGTVLASVESRPLVELVTYMLKESDNTLAEMLARQVSLEMGFDGSSTSLGEALVSALDPYGVDATEVSIRDGSGLSDLNRVSAQYVGGVLVEAFRSQGSLGLIAEALPIAGVDGSLGSRFAGDNAVAQQRVQAKTGTISGTRSLAGFVQSADGTDLVFAFFAHGDVDDDARTAIETVVSGVYSCGSNLADF